MDFYNSLSSDYDKMTNAVARAQKELSFYENILENNRVFSILDVGCGTGHLVKLFAEKRIFTHGIDPSPRMLSIAKENLKGMETLFSLNIGNFASIANIVESKVDIVFSVGNTIPHLMTKQQLKIGFENVRKVLKSDGLFVLQLLNYSKILTEKNRIVNITRHDTKTFVRFYDFFENILQFNILTADETPEGITHSLNSTRLYPWQQPEIREALLNTGFNEIKMYGDYSLSLFSPARSGSLVIMAR